MFFERSYLTQKKFMFFEKRPLSGFPYIILYLCPVFRT